MELQEHDSAATSFLIFLLAQRVTEVHCYPMQGRGYTLKYKSIYS